LLHLHPSNFYSKGVIIALFFPKLFELISLFSLRPTIFYCFQVKSFTLSYRIFTSPFLLLLLTIWPTFPWWSMTWTIFFITMVTFMCSRSSSPWTCYWCCLLFFVGVVTREVVPLLGMLQQVPTMQQTKWPLIRICILVQHTCLLNLVLLGDTALIRTKHLTVPWTKLTNTSLNDTPTVWER